MRTLIIAEYILNDVKPSTYATLDAAKQIGGDIDIIVIGNNTQANCTPLKALNGVQNLLIVDDVQLTYPTAEQLVAILKPLSKKYTTIMAPATTFGKNFMPRLASVLNVGQISDITAVLGPDTFIRPIYAGNVLQTIQSLDETKLITVRPAAFNMIQQAQSGAPAIQIIALSEPLPQKTRVTKFSHSQSNRPELTAARVVVSGGRGIGNAENFKLLDALADKLHAAVGASRVAVDSGYVPNDYQVGQTGKVVSPDLYIAVGISGAIQHLAGMKDSKYIVAINKDPDAPIFQVANYGLVGDLFDIIPELTQKLG